MFLKLEIILVILFVMGLLISMVWLFRIETRLKRFFSGKKGRDLESAIEILETKIKELDQVRQKMEAELQSVDKKLKKSIRGLETIRFNPFPDQGSNQSFAIGMLNEEGDGVVISSLYARDRMSVFAKPVKAGKSQYELTDEEKEALKKAEI